MKKIICHAAMLLGLTISLSVAAAFFEQPQDYTHAPLKGLKTIAVNIDPPRGSDYTEMIRYGVTKDQLQEMIATRLRDAGFKVISYTESLEDPEAVLLDLRVRVDLPRSSFYAFDLKLSVNQKFPLAQGAGSFTSIRTWSDRQIGALQISGPGLYPLYGFSMNLVENFIKDHQAQN
jgi:hypothetical protein